MKTFILKNLKLLRRSYGLSQQQLADVLGISQQSINKYETRDVQPDLETLKKMADYFHTTIDFLVDYGGRNEAAQNQPTITFSPEEANLISHYRRLGNIERICLNLLLKTWNKNAENKED